MGDTDVVIIVGTLRSGRLEVDADFRFFAIYIPCDGIASGVKVCWLVTADERKWLNKFAILDCCGSSGEVFFRLGEYIEPFIMIEEAEPSISSIASGLISFTLLIVEISSRFLSELFVLPLGDGVLSIQCLTSSNNRNERTKLVFPTCLEPIITTFLSTERSVSSFGFERIEFGGV